MQLSVELDPTSVRTETPQDGPPVPRFDEGRVCEFRHYLDTAKHIKAVKGSLAAA